MKNPYETLGVAPNATDMEIRLAFRRLAAQAHPDREGGSVDRMQELNLAYGLLTDPQRRKRFDETGNTEKVKPIREQAKHMLLGLVDLVIIDEKLDEDLVEVLRRNLKSSLGEMNKTIKEAGRRIEHLKRVMGRNKAKKGVHEDLFRMAGEARAAQLTEHIENCEKQKLLIAEAIQLMDDYEFGNLPEDDQEALLRRRYARMLETADGVTFTIHR